VLGLTATPYRLGLGWIYQHHAPRRLMRTGEDRYFRTCVYELSLRTMIERGWLTPPIRIDAPVASPSSTRMTMRSPNSSD